MADRDGMFEKAARAISGAPFATPRSLAKARRVIAVLRQPSEAMIREMESASSFGIGKPVDDEAVPRVWRAGIDAILAELRTAAEGGE